jgi:hypothetical protein
MAQRGYARIIWVETHRLPFLGLGSGADPNPNLPVVPSETSQRARAGYPVPLAHRGFHYAHPQLLHHCPGGAGGRADAVMEAE